MLKIKNGVVVNYVEEKGVTSVVIPYGVTSIGAIAFYRCNNLTSISIPNSVTNIGYNAFYGCKSLTSVTIPNSVTSIGDFAFSDCTSLTSVIIPDGVTNIGEGAFDGCTSLTSVIIPDSVTNIGEGAFGLCKNLTNVTVGKSVASIGKRAFFGCTRLTSITIPDSMKSIGGCAFYGCKKLKTEKANYKAFDITLNKLICRNYEFKEDKWSKDITDISLCEQGYHFCENLYFIFNFYPGVIDKDIAIYECEIGNKVIKGNDKSVTNKIKPVKRLYRKDIIKILNNIN